jgi:hypothetical protein
VADPMVATTLADSRCVAMTGGVVVLVSITVAFTEHINADPAGTGVTVLIQNVTVTVPLKTDCA